MLLSLNVIAFGLGQEQALFRSRGSNVHQAPFLLKGRPLTFPDASGVREYSVAQPDDEHVRELQSLALMDGHQLDFVGLLPVVGVRVQGDVLKVIVERKLLPFSVFAFVKPYGIHQLGDVLQALLVIVVTIFLLQAGLFEDIFKHRADSH